MACSGLDIRPISSQAESDAVNAGRPALVGVGSLGGPDDVIPVVWLCPAV
jgi:hypothetical protein